MMITCGEGGTSHVLEYRLGDAGRTALRGYDPTSKNWTAIGFAQNGERYAQVMTEVPKHQTPKAGDHSSDKHEGVLPSGEMTSYRLDFFIESKDSYSVKVTNITVGETNRKMLQRELLANVSDGFAEQNRAPERRDWAHGQWTIYRRRPGKAGLCGIKGSSVKVARAGLLARVWYSVEPSAVAFRRRQSTVSRYRQGSARIGCPSAYSSWAGGTLMGTDFFREKPVRNVIRETRNGSFAGQLLTARQQGYPRLKTFKDAACGRALAATETGGAV